MMSPDARRSAFPSSAVLPLLLVGRSTAAQRLRDDVATAAAASRLVIEAEPGLEPADLALACHVRARVGGPFVPIDGGYAEPAAVERELFGAPGPSPLPIETISAQSALARAAGGTLFVGNLADLSQAAQARLARVARDGEVRVAGTNRRLDVRLSASVAPGPEGDVRHGRLRADVLRELGRQRVIVPPLRQRPDDIAVFVQHLVLDWCADAGRPAIDATEPAMTLLAAMPWRGNLSELRQAVLRLTAVAGDTIRLEDVLAHVRFDGSLGPATPTTPLKAARDQFERDYVTLVLRHHQWQVGDAARTLGIQRPNLYRKVRQLGIALSRGAGR